MCVDIPLDAVSVYTYMDVRGCPWAALSALVLEES